MNLIRKKLTDLLVNTAKGSLRSLEVSSPCAAALKEIDVEEALKEDIGRICEEATYREIIKIMSLAGRVHLAGEEEHKKIKRELKDIAAEIVSRVEASSGKLHIPEPCRFMIMEL